MRQNSLADILERLTDGRAVLEHDLFGVGRDGGFGDRLQLIEIALQRRRVAGRILSVISADQISIASVDIAAGC
ncbi:hypothetical protein [Mesorhizobium sp. M0091]|uniref:hypothetical protein n=1 Tax=Mesorhizobium sp. M0091 TaxID=2956875 RepID=UPI003338C5C0